MKSWKKIVLNLTLSAALIASIAIPAGKADVAHASAAEKLLSGNAVGSSLFPAGTATHPTGADYSWLTEGIHATDATIISTDNDGPPDMSDGINGPDGSFSNNSAWASNTAAYGTLIYDLKAVYKVSTVKVWADTAANSGMKKFEVLASIDGLTYNPVGTGENTNAPNTGFAPVELAVKPFVFARYIKVIMHKDELKFNMRLGEVAVYGDEAGEQSLLSNNSLRSSGPYNTSTPKLPTNASYTWVTAQPFVTQAGLIATDNDAVNDGVGGIADLIDGSSTETSADTTVSSAPGSQGTFGAVIFDLKNDYQVGTIDVWTLADSNHYMDGYEVLVSNDGWNYTSLGYTANTNSRTANAMVNTASSGVSGKNAKFVKIVMHNAHDSEQLTIGEIAIWGWTPYKTPESTDGTPDKVELRAELKNYSVAYLDWSSYNHVANNVNKYRVYVETTDFTTVTGLTYKMNMDKSEVKYTPYFALKPETTYYIAVTPFKTAGAERKDVTTIRITTPSILGGAVAGDIFAVNDPPYGYEEKYTKHPNEAANMTTKMVLLKEIGGIHKNRWSDHNNEVKKEYGRRGVSFHMFYHGEGKEPADNEHGAWTFSTFNEPDMVGSTGYKTPAQVAAAIGSNHSALKAIDSRNLLVEPALHGVDAGTLNYLAQMYDSDGQNGALVKTYFDVMDVHPYVKSADAPVTGLVYGAPEKLISKISDLKALMASRGDADKPIVFTEIGWSTFNGQQQFMKAVDRPTQRNYLARAYMHSIAGGIKSVFWHNFQDRGTNPAEIELNFGIIDWHGVPKPSYYGYYTLVRALRYANYLGEVTNISNPYYGYKFWDERKNRYITALWDASWETTSTTSKTAVLTTTDAGVSVVGIDGSHQYVPATAGTVEVKITGAPVFIYSNKSVSVASMN
ncbi:discoidin domain-containing protein [Paenibacillus puerhi]|uniref:discoidin domain-containing protein n=1 Tax=Paenibacillus puerhi TaxID=2692622 RepID=UPI00135C2E2F|nr:discoidin domain-containing protein [Paenibacillus puerhi]